MLQHYCFSFCNALLALSTVGLPIVLTTSVSAQIVPDNSLGNESSIVTPNVAIKDKIADLIEGGAIRGNNLFHSFEQFNISNNAAVYFANPDGIANILTRVTGNNISEIFGTLGGDGTANLFLLNPNGIVFGKNAVLDVNGSFFATTADSYIFDNGFEYSASNPQAPPLLTINLPVGVQMGNNSGKIKVQDSGHNIIRQTDLDPFINFDNSNGLRLKPNQTFSLVANQIEIDAGILVVPEGEIQLGSVAQGKVILNPQNSNSWSLDYTEIEQFADINLSNKALIDISGINSGAINLRGNNIILETASVISSNNSGKESAKAIAIEAEELIKLTGLDQNTLTRTSIASDYFGLQKGVSIHLKSKNLFVTNGGFIEASNRYLGQGGDVQLKISDSITINGLNPINSVVSSGILTANFAGGKAGNVVLDANQIEVVTGGNITSNVFADGAGGDIVVNAPESVFLSGFDPNTYNPSVISSFSFNQGDAGNLIINTGLLKLSDSARIDSTSFAGGNAGSLQINASESVEIIGLSLNSLLSSSISSSALTNPVPIIKQVFNLPDLPSGNSGNLTITTPQLKITNRADVTVQNLGLGDGGNLNIDADIIVLETGGKITASTLSGNGGNIYLKISEQLILRDRSLISAEAQQAGNGGNINLNADAIALLNGSSIVANAFEGNGGNINITTVGLFVSYDSLISSGSKYGLDGNVKIDEVTSDRKFEFNQLPENIVDTTNLITPSCLPSDNNSFAAIGNGGVPNSPYSTQSLSTTWYDLRPVKEQSNNLAVLPTPLPEANTTIINADGKLELVALTSLSTHRWVKSNCRN